MLKATSGAPVVADRKTAPQLLLGCTCAGTGNTGAHDRSCIWGNR